MSNTKTVMGQASNQYVAPTDITDVFSTYLYDGTGAAQTITNGIDLADEGGLVWIQERDDGSNSYSQLFDTERGANKSLTTQVANAQSTETQTLMAFNSDGFNLGTDGGVNASTKNNVAWTFRKAPKFFDIVTYTGNGTAGTQIAHGLGSVPGMIIFKKTSASDNWAVYHRGANGGTDPEDYRLELNETFAQSNRDWLNDTAPTATHFTVGDGALSNTNNETYVAYLFAHNDGDGGFGPDGSDIIKCGSYSGNGADDGPEIDLGFEPQWLLVKRASGGTGEWALIDTMRGFTADGSDAVLKADSSDAENSQLWVSPSSTGFKLRATSSAVNASGNNYIYMAIRRGPLAPPESATEVFAMDEENSSAPYYTSNFPVDFGLQKRKASSGDWYTFDRLRGTKILKTNLNSVESTDNSGKFDYMDGFISNAAYGAGNSYGWMWKRAPGYFDVVAYSGTNSATTISHNLTVSPDMMWVKSRANANRWTVFHKDQGPTKRAFLDLTQGFDTGSVWNNTAPTSTVFSVGTDSNTNSSGHIFIAYLFSTLAGISKVGSYTGTGAALNIDCGFTSGARFVMIKRTDAGGQWFVFDSLRGIVSGNDPFLRLNNDADEETAYDIIDPLSSGFSLTSNNDWETNISGGSYIFYAIA